MSPTDVMEIGLYGCVLRDASDGTLATLWAQAWQLSDVATLGRLEIEIDYRAGQYRPHRYCPHAGYCPRGQAICGAARYARHYLTPARYDAPRIPWPGDRPTVVDVAAARGDRDDRGGGDDISLDGEA